MTRNRFPNGHFVLASSKQPVAHEVSWKPFNAASANLKQENHYVVHELAAQDTFSEHSML